MNEERESDRERQSTTASKRQAGNAQFGFHLLDQHIQYALMSTYTSVCVCVCMRS